MTRTVAIKITLTFEDPIVDREAFEDKLDRDIDRLFALDGVLSEVADNQLVNYQTSNLVFIEEE